MISKTKLAVAAFLICAVFCGITLAVCPSSDLTGDCFVDMEDFGLLAEQWLMDYDVNTLTLTAAEWLTTDPCLPQDMAYIPDGTFQMGDSLNEGFIDELPVHTVSLGYFFMGKYEVTNQQYCDFLNAVYPAQIKIDDGYVKKADSNEIYCDTSEFDFSSIAFSGSSFYVITKSGRSMMNDPMAYLSWFGAAAYCNWLSLQQGRQPCYNLTTWDCDFSKNGYHLPTEAQWEYAARGGLVGKRIPWGDTLSQTKANFYGTAEPYNHPLWVDVNEPFTCPVGFFDGAFKLKTDYAWPGVPTDYQTENGVNGYGLYDIAGNVAEWCNDWYNPAYSPDAQSEPTGPITGTEHVLRGGGWNDIADSCRTSFRTKGGPDTIGRSWGFRLTLE